MPGSEIAEAFERTCRDRRDVTALVWLPDGRAVTFGALHDRDLAARAAPRDHGVRAARCVASLVGHHPVYFPVSAAVMDAGAALLPIGEATDAEAAAIVRNSQAVAVITDRRLPVPIESQRPLDTQHAILRVRGAKTERSYGRSLVIKL